MPNLSVVIPSRTDSNLIQCMQAVRQHEPDVPIVVVDDGLTVSPDDYLKFGPVMVVKGQKPFVFSVNVNIGIKACGDDDCVILNDDALLKNPGGFSLMQKTAQEHLEYGVIAATTNNTGNVNQRPRAVGLREDPRMVTFICVLIPRRTIEKVGLLSEDFTAYGFDDDDYCYRVRHAGLKIGIQDFCFVDHASLPSTFRGDPKRPANLEDGKAIFIKKWGSYPL